MNAQEIKASITALHGLPEDQVDGAITALESAMDSYIAGLPAVKTIASVVVNFTDGSTETVANGTALVPAGTETTTQATV